MTGPNQPRGSTGIHKYRPALVVAVSVLAATLATATGTASASPRQPADLDFGSLGPGSLEGLDLGSLEGLPFGSLDGLFGPSPPVQQCNQQTKSGGEGVTETRHILGRTGPTAFTLDYETVNQPDEIKVFYQGRLVHNTGYVGDNLNEGTGSARVTLPPGAQNYVVVRVTGPEEGTVWEYTVHCPT